MNNKPNILLIYTGGTIGMIKDYETNALKAFDFENIKERIPELQLVDCQLETISFEKPIDSSDMNPDLWRRIADIIETHYEDHDGFVVLTGTDTMSYTASALSFMLTTSEPAPGSLIARAPTCSPEMSFGRKRAFCSPVHQRRSWLTQRLECAP